MNIATFTSKRFLVPVVLTLIVVLLATAPLYNTAGTIPLMTTILMYIILAASWTMFSGPTGYISLASAAFFGVGVYTSALLFEQEVQLLPLPAVILIGGLIASCFALIVGLATLRLRGIYFTMFSFGLLELARQLTLYYEFTVTETRGRYVATIDVNTAYYLLLAMVVATLLTAYFISRSRYGLALQGIGKSEEAAAHMGVNTTMVKVVIFAISAFFMGATGAIMATRWLYIDPTIAFNLNYSFLPLLMAIVGGVGQLYGPVIGAFGFAYLRHTLISVTPHHFMLIFGGIMVLVVLFLPGGIAGLVSKLQSKLTEPLAESGEERTWKPTAAGILSIIGGVAQVFGGIVFAIGSRWIAQFSGMQFIGGVIGWFSGFYAVIAALLIILGLVAVLGGICALRRRIWGLALAGSICTLPLFVFGIPAVIFAILGKGEFKYAIVKGGEAEQYANT
jgi:branched-chain amino acid transport system permease protein